jgi:hypothetical protein
MEMWKPVIGYEGLYEISDLANVRRVGRAKKLDATKIPAAKQMLNNGAFLREVAEFLDTSIATASMIKNGKTWHGDAAYRKVKTPAGSDHYLRFAACKNGKYTKVSVHRALWEAFIGPIEGRLEVNHKDLDRTNNNLSNLELLTHQQNIQHAQDIYKRERIHLPKGQRSGPFGRFENC